jgi:hypothetical protein
VDSSQWACFEPADLTIRRQAQYHRAIAASRFYTLTLAVESF